LHFGGMEGAEARFVSLGWPTDMDDIMSDLQIYAKDLYLVAQAFFDMNFPDYSWRVRFGAFRLGRSRLPVAVAKEFIRELAVKEGHADPAQTVYQYEQMLPHMPRLFRETGDDRKAWIAGVERFRRKDFPEMFRADFGNIINLVLTYVCFLDGTGCVERAFSRLELLELKRRVNHLKAIHVKDALQICLSMPDAIDALVTRVPYPVHRTIADKELEFRILWTPCDRIRNAQRKYLEFFGGRRLQSRSLVPTTLQQRAHDSVRARSDAGIARTPKVQQAGQALKISKTNLKRRWLDATGEMVEGMRERKRLRTLEGVPREVLALPTDPCRRIIVRGLRAKRIADEKQFRACEARGVLARPPTPFRAPRDWCCVRQAMPASLSIASVSSSIASAAQVVASPPSLPATLPPHASDAMPKVFFPKLLGRNAHRRFYACAVISLRRRREDPVSPSMCSQTQRCSLLKHTAQVKISSSGAEGK
jgi:hypothetical protein